MIAASLLLEALRDLWGPGLVFLVLCAWLVRRAVRAARNESILEEQRMRSAFGEFIDPESEAPPEQPAANATKAAEQPPTPAEEPSNVTELAHPSAPPPSRAAHHVPPRLAGADVRGAVQDHLDVVARAVTEREAVPGAHRNDILWVRSTPTHVVWAERRQGQREVICVAQIDAGKIVARWQFG